MPNPAMDLLPDEVAAQSGFAKPVTVDFQEDVAIVTMRRGENRFNFDFVHAMNQALDDVLYNESCIGMVLTGEGKFFSNGLDLDWMAKLGARKNSNLAIWAAYYLHPFTLRLATFPLPVVAALNGHTYAQGAITSLACDHRVMREDRGWFCLNETRIGISLGPVSSKLLKCRLPAGPVFHDAVVLARRYTAAEALAAGIVHSTAPQDQLINTAVKAVRGLKGIKREYLKNAKTDFTGSELEPLIKDLQGGVTYAKL